MEVNFRIATKDDVDKIVKLCNECFEENTNVETAKLVFNLTKNDNNQIYLIGECNNDVVAHTKITIVPTMFEGMQTYAILNHVCVKPDLRRNIGTKMLERVQKICQERNCISIKLWSANFRIPAHTCYKKFGFEPFDATFFQKII